ncbi:hypothetical protein [Streptomyces sp. BSE7-9]|uniref:hypothetical protein n=1 Tax=Streptomyces sp. BSE7-9 TaxID=2759948 RepID=UPI001E3FF95B|nr:hypothetical protein [Streptomyces sp. BSE7-9]
MSFAGRPFTTFAVAVAGCCAGLTLIGPASADVAPRRTAPAAAPRPDDDSPAKSRVIRVEARLYAGEELDPGAAGRTVGDQFVFSGDLASAEAGEERVGGSIGGFCVITDLERNAGQCASTAVLPEGQITVQGEQAGIPLPGRGRQRDHRRHRDVPPLSWPGDAAGVDAGDLAAHLRTPRRATSPARGRSRPARGAGARAAVTARHVAAPNGPRGRP